MRQTSLFAYCSEKLEELRYVNFLFCISCSSWVFDELICDCCCAFFILIATRVWWAAIWFACPRLHVFLQDQQPRGEAELDWCHWSEQGMKASPADGVIFIITCWSRSRDYCYAHFVWLTPVGEYGTPFDGICVTCLCYPHCLSGLLPLLSQRYNNMACVNSSRSPCLLWFVSPREFWTAQLLMGLLFAKMRCNFLEGLSVWGFCCCFDIFALICSKRLQKEPTFLPLA